MRAAPSGGPTAAQDFYPFAARFPDGGRAGRFANEVAACIHAEKIGGTYHYAPRSRA